MVADWVMDKNMGMSCSKVGVQMHDMCKQPKANLKIRCEEAEAENWNNRLDWDDLTGRWLLQIGRAHV